MVSKEEFRKAVIEGVKRVRDLESIDMRDDESFSDVGLDSLDGMNLVLEVETILGINLGEFDLKEANTINSFYEKARQILESR